MLAAGRWVQTGPDNNKTHSYHISSLYSPLGWKSWADIVSEFLAAKDNPSDLKTWVNTILGETWEDTYSAVLDPMNLMSKSEAYDVDTLPDGVLCLTMGVDVQDDRLAISVYGWGIAEETYAVFHQEIDGDPSSPALWDTLDGLRTRQYRRKDGKVMRIEMCAIDSGGHYTQTVYDYARNRRGEVIAVKGSSVSGKPVVSKPSKVDFKLGGKTVKNGVELYPVGTDTAKTTIYQRIKKVEGQGVWHFSHTLTAEYFNQLTAEKQILQYSRGMAKRVWVKKDSARNEALDTAVYAYAALHWMYFKYSRATIWQRLAERLTNQDIASAPVEPAEVVTQQVAHQAHQAQVVRQESQPIRRKSSFWG
jgi:phage terminase large subunit GpA-like protein